MSLQQAIEQVNTINRPAFIPYVMAGDGGLANLPSIISRLEKLGATAIEIGIPFTDPVADGPVIEEAGMRALANGTTLKKVIETLRNNRNEFSIPLIFMSYLNPILAYGQEQFARDAYEAGVRGVIIPDMPLEEKDILHPYLKASNIALIQLISLTSDADRMEKLSKASEGFIYAVTVNGVTGVRKTFNDELATHFAKLKQLSNVPVLAGFGISTAEHVEHFAKMSDGVIVGSRIVSAIADNDWASIENLMAVLKQPQ